MKLLQLFPLLCSLTLFADEYTFPWVVYYGTSASIEELAPYNPILLDRDYPLSIAPLLKAKKEVLGYISLGEVDDRDPWYSEAKNQGILIDENTMWLGSWAVDIRHPYWKELVLNSILPMLVAKGFTGFFFDQLDISLNLEKRDPLKYKGMKNAAIDLVHAIHQKFPHHRLMLNRAYEIVPDIGNDIEYLLAETLYTLYNFETKEYGLRTKEEFDWQLSELNKIRKEFPHIVLFSLDYWDPKDTAMYQTIYELERKECVRPYISTILLDEIIPEPKPAKAK